MIRIRDFNLKELFDLRGQGKTMQFNKGINT